VTSAPLSMQPTKWLVALIIKVRAFGPEGEGRGQQRSDLVCWALQLNRQHTPVCSKSWVRLGLIWIDLRKMFSKPRPCDGAAPMPFELLCAGHGEV